MSELSQISNKKKLFKRKFMNKDLIKNKLNFGKEILNSKFLKIRYFENEK